MKLSQHLLTAVHTRRGIAQARARIAKDTTHISAAHTIGIVGSCCCCTGTQRQSKQCVPCRRRRRHNQSRPNLCVRQLSKIKSLRRAVMQLTRCLSNAKPRTFRAAMTMKFATQQQTSIRAVFARATRSASLNIIMTPAERENGRVVSSKTKNNKTKIFLTFCIFWSSLVAFLEA